MAEPHFEVYLFNEQTRTRTIWGSFYDHTRAIKEAIAASRRYGMQVKATVEETTNDGTIVIVGTWRRGMKI